MLCVLNINNMSTGLFLIQLTLVKGLCCPVPILVGVSCDNGKTQLINKITVGIHALCNSRWFDRGGDADGWVSH